MFNRFLGCFLGGAVGDALGAAVEFVGFDEIRRLCGPNGVTGYVEFEDEVGRFTDDTQMTLFTAEALVREELSERIASAGGCEGAGPCASEVSASTVSPGAPAAPSGADVRLERTRAIGHRAYLRWLATQGIEPDCEALALKREDVLNGWLVNEPGLRVRRGPGLTCVSSLESALCGTTSHPANDSKGCGGAMRVAPVGLWARDAGEAFRVGCELAAITHGHPSGYLSAGFLSALICSLRGGRSLLESIGDARSLLRGWPDHEECLEAVDAALDLARERPEPSAANIRTLGGGWVGEEALAIAIYCGLGFPGDFRLGVLAAVNHGGDSDSTGAIAGNILGAMLGKEAIPREWVDNLELAWIVRQVAADLFTAVAGRGGRAASGPKGEPGPRVDPGAGLDPDLSLAERYPVTV